MDFKGLENAVLAKDAVETGTVNKEGKTVLNEQATGPEVLTDNPFDPTHLRLRQDFSTMAGVKKLILSIPVQKPNRQEFIRVHPDERMSLTTMILEFSENRGTAYYLVAPELWDELDGELQPKTLLVTINRHRDLSIWPSPVPQEGPTSLWTESAMMGAEKAKRCWVRVASNMRLKGYDVYEAPALAEEPEWHDMTLQEILRIAFRDKYIKDLSHPVIRRLKGLI